MWSPANQRLVGPKRDKPDGAPCAFIARFLVFLSVEGGVRVGGGRSAGTSASQGAGTRTPSDVRGS